MSTDDNENWKSAGSPVNIGSRPKPAESFKELLEQWRQSGDNPNGPVREVYGWAADELEALLKRLGVSQ